MAIIRVMVYIDGLFFAAKMPEELYENISARVKSEGGRAGVVIRKIRRSTKNG